MPIAAMGTSIKKGTTAIGSLTSIAGLELSMDTIDTTTLDSVGGYRTFIGGLRDGGEVSLSGYFDAVGHAQLLTDFDAGTSGSYTIEFTGGAKWTFTAVVTGISTGTELEDLVSFEATLKVSGKPTLSPTGI